MNFSLKKINNIIDTITIKNMQKVRQIPALREEMEIIKTDMELLKNIIDSFEGDISAINSKLDKIVQLFSIVFDSDGSIASNNYTTHKHNYTDATIADTADGTGTLTETTKTTTIKV